jgi:hypothetical protein
MTGVARAIGSAAVLTTMLAVAPLSAQDAWAGSVIETYTLADVEPFRPGRVRVLTAPFGVRWSWPKAAVSVTGGYARGIATLPGGGRSEIAGPTDTRVAMALSGAAWSLGSFLDVPTGDASHTLDELLLLGIVSSELLPFEVGGWGAGGRAGVTARVFRRVGRVAIGIGGGYVLPRAYDPLGSIAPTYRPGREIRMSVEMEATVGTATTLTLLLGHQRFGTDDADDINVFLPGTRFEAFVALTHPLGARESISGYAGVYGRRGGTIVLGSELPPTRRVLGLLESEQRRLHLAGIEIQALRSRFSLTPAVEMRQLVTQGSTGGGWLGTIAVEAEVRLAGRAFGHQLTAVPEMRTSVGAIEASDGAEVGVTGWRAGMTLRWRQAR